MDNKLKFVLMFPVGPLVLANIVALIHSYVAWEWVTIIDYFSIIPSANALQRFYSIIVFFVILYYGGALSCGLFTSTTKKNKP